MESVIEVMEDSMSMTSSVEGEEDDISAKPVVTLIVPRIITSSPNDRTLSVIEEAPSVADSYAPFSRVTIATYFFDLILKSFFTIKLCQKLRVHVITSKTIGSVTVNNS